jgi:hypothetical protein
MHQSLAFEGLMLVGIILLLLTSRNVVNQISRLWSLRGYQWEPLYVRMVRQDVCISVLLSGLFSVPFVMYVVRLW